MSEIGLKPKVLIVSSYGPPHPGGLERAVARIYEEVKKRGVNVRWLLSDVPVLPPEPDTIRVRVWNQLDTKFRLAIPLPKPSAYARLYREIAQSDLVHMHDGYYLICFAAMVMAKIQRKRTVLTVHIWNVPYKNPVIQLMQKVGFALLVTPTVWLADSVVSYNHRIYRILAGLKPNPHYIANGVDPSFCAGPALSPASVREQLGLPLDKKIVVFAGRFSLKKGIPILREIARNVPDVFFVMCGTGPEQPEKWNLPNVRNLGWVNAEKLKTVFSCADLFLLPSRGEGFPLAIQEAMSQGLPCAVFEETWNSLGDARELFLILDDFATPSEAIRAYFAQPDASRKSAEIAAYTKAHWTVDAMAEAYLQVYQETLKNAGEHPQAERTVTEV
jgi:glycosyltransferase involved in cell wall biosynthesis